MNRLHRRASPDETHTHACTRTKERMNGRDIGERVGGGCGGEARGAKGDMVAVMYTIGPTGVHDGRLLAGYGMMAPRVIPRYEGTERLSRTIVESRV